MDKDLINLIIQHEGLEPYQTPFRITDPKMANWTSMFDNTLKVGLNPKAKKSEGRENFLYLLKQEDLNPAVNEQFRRYDMRNKGITVEDAIKIFDQTGAEGKLNFLKQNGIHPKKPLIEYLGEDQGVANQMLHNLNR